MARKSITFLRNGRPVTLTDVGPTETLLDYLRLREGGRDTKEGCAEGDCGACTVAIGTRTAAGGMTYRAVNACILMLGQVAERDIITARDLVSEEGVPHPVQDAMVRHHGSQCGFCTPGIVMSLFTLYHQPGQPNRAMINDCLAGNLCRCTGYRPIADAAMEACSGQASDAVVKEMTARAASLAQLDTEEDIFISTGLAFLAAPASETSLQALLGEHPDATLVAGATDVGLWVTKQLRALSKIILLQRIEGFDGIEEGDGDIVIGAGATYEDAEAALGGIDPDLAELIRRIGSKQVRASGTVGGNIANGSPIGDTPPALIALNAELVLRSAAGERRMALEDFFIDYGKQDRRPGDYIAAVKVPKPRPDQSFRCYKISKRFDQDISAVMGAFLFTVEAGRVVDARVAFGGMAATPKRAAVTERALTGLVLAEPNTWWAVADCLAQDFAPIDDMRASAAYRQEAAKGLLIKALTEIAGEETGRTRVIGQREGRDVRAA